MSSEFRTKDVSLRVQKKLASRFSNKSVAKAVVDDTTSQLLDDAYRLCKNVSGNKKDSEKVMKNIIKIIVKLGILYRNNQFSHEEMVLLTKFQRKFHMMAMTIISFYEIDFSYDRSFILKALADMRAMLSQLVSRHLTDKTVSRVDHVFDFFHEARLLDAIFKSDSAHKELLGKIARTLDSLLETDTDDGC